MNYSCLPLVGHFNSRSDRDAATPVGAAEQVEQLCKGATLPLPGKKQRGSEMTEVSLKKPRSHREPLRSCGGAACVGLLAGAGGLDVKGKWKTEKVAPER